MTFSETLRMIIEDNGLTQKQLAQNLHIAVSTMGGYVQGTSEPDFETLKIIAKYFEVSSDFLLNLQTGKIESNSEEELLCIFRSLTTMQQELYLEQGKAFKKVALKVKSKK